MHIQRSNEPQDGGRTAAASIKRGPIQEAYRAILKELGISDTDVRDCRQKVLLHLMGKSEDILIDQDALDAARFRLATTLAEIRMKHPSVDPFVTKVALSFAAFAPDHSDELRVRTLRSIHSLDPKLGTQLCLLKSTTNGTDRLACLQLLEQIDQPLHIAVAVDAIRSAAKERPREVERLSRLLPDPILNVVQESGMLNPDIRLDPRKFFPQALALIEQTDPPTPIPQQMKRILEYQETRKRVPTPDTITEGNIISTVLALVPLITFDRIYGTSVAAGLVALHQESIRNVGAEKITNFFCTIDPSVGDLITSFFKPDGKK